MRSSQTLHANSHELYVYIGGVTLQKRKIYSPVLT